MCGNIFVIVREKDVRACDLCVLAEKMYSEHTRGANGVGYKNYPDNVIREFVKQSAKSGIDVFRIFDSLNWVQGMEIDAPHIEEQPIAFAIITCTS